MHQSEAVRRPTVWYAIILMTAVLCIMIAAITELVYYSITSGAVALFVP